MASNKEGLENARRAFAEKLWMEMRDIREDELPDPGDWEARKLAFRSAGRDTRRAEYSEAAERRILRKGSAIVKSINKELDYRIRAEIGPKPKTRDAAKIWRERAKGIQLQFWKDIIRTKRFARIRAKAKGEVSAEVPVDPARLRAFALYMKEAMQDPRFKKDLVKVAEYATARMYDTVYEPPIAPSVRGRSFAKTIFRSPPRESGESKEGYEARVAMARIRHYAGDVALPNVSPIDFNDIYMKRPPKRSSFQFTVNDPTVKIMIAEGMAPSEAIKALGDFAYAASLSQYAEVQKRHRLEPVEILVDDPESDPPPNRDDFGYEVGGAKRYEAALKAWFDERSAAKTATKYYVCKACSSSVMTGHKCRCTIDKKAGKVQKYFRYPVEFKKPTYPPFAAPPRRVGEPDQDYELRVKRAKDGYDKANARKTTEAFEKYKKARDEYLIAFEQRNVYRNLPSYARIIANIDAKVRREMGKVPSKRDPKALAEYNLERAKRTTAEFQREIQDRIASTKIEDLRILSPKALKAATRKDGTVSPYLLVRAMEREAEESLAEKLSIPGTALVTAKSKTEAEDKATALVSSAMAREYKLTTGPGVQLPSMEQRTEVTGRGGMTSTERRLDQLRRKMGRGEPLSFKERLEYDRLMRQSEIVIESATLPTRLKGLSGFMDDFGGNVTGLAVAGLAVFAIFKAFKARSA